MNAGKVLPLPVSVLMISVGRLVRNPHRKKGDQRRDQVQPRVRRLRQNSQRTRRDPTTIFSP